MDEPLLGQLLLRLGLLSDDQLQDALRQQLRRLPRRLLGELLVEMGVLDEGNLRGILGLQRARAEAAGKGDKARPPKQSAEEELRNRLAGASLAEFLLVAREHGASDLHVGPGRAPALRIDGALRELPVEPFDAAACQALLLPALSLDDSEALARRKSVDVAWHDEQAGRFRLHVFRESGGLCGVARAIAANAWEFEALGLPPQVAEVERLDHGLVLVTGVVGSGKSTTLAAILQRINRTRAVHVVTIEDPIEVVHASDRALFSQREVGTHTRDHASALRAALREDPDVIVVGELRDLETASIALSAAETGHLVFATLHTGRADHTIHRLVDQFPGHLRERTRSVLAGVLRMVICQHLLPAQDGRGRVLAAEVLRVTPAVAHLIREGRVHQVRQAMQLGRRDGMALLDDALLDLVRARRVAPDEAYERCVDPETFSAALAGA